MKNNLQLVEGGGAAAPPSGMNRQQARSYLQNMRRQCDRLRRMAREAAKAGDRSRARAYFQKFRQCKAQHMAMAEKLGLGRRGGRRPGRPHRVGMRTMIGQNRPSHGRDFGFFGDPDDGDDQPMDVPDLVGKAETLIAKVSKVAPYVAAAQGKFSVPFSTGKSGGKGTIDIFIDPKTGSGSVGVGGTFMKASEAEIHRMVSPFIPRIPTTAAAISSSAGDTNGFGGPIGLRTMLPRGGPTGFDPRTTSRVLTPGAPGQIYTAPDPSNRWSSESSQRAFLDREMQGFGDFDLDLGGKTPSLMKLGLFAAVGAVAIGMHGKTKKQKRNSALIGAGLGAAASYLF